MTKEDINSLKESIDTLIDENERLRKKIEILESERQKEETHNVLDKEIRLSLDRFLKEYKCPDNDKYKPHIDDDWSYDPERDKLDWSYRPKRGTDGPYYPWPSAPEVGDWPPGSIPPGYPYWSIYPPYWPIPYYKNTLKTNTTGDPTPEYPYTVSKTGEKIER